MYRAEPDVRPHGAASPSGKSIQVVEISLAAIWQLANDTEYCIVEPRGVCGALNLQAGKWRTKKFQGVESAGLEIDGQKCSR